MKLWERKRLTTLKKIEKDKKILYCYIYKGAYYRPDAAGYTDHRHEAGIYTKEEALVHARHCDDLTLIPIDIMEHNKMLCEKINFLVSRIITKGLVSNG